MEELIKQISKAKTGDQNTIQSLIEMFTPLINKYTKAAHWDEDTRSELILTLIEVIHKMDIDSFKTPNDYAVLKYIKRSIVNKYIQINKDNAIINLIEEYAENIYYGERNNPDLYDEYRFIALNETIRSLLTNKEYYCFIMIYDYGYSPAEVARITGVSRQTIHETKRRAVDKLNLSSTILTN